MASHVTGKGRVGSLTAALPDIGLGLVLTGLLCPPSLLIVCWVTGTTGELWWQAETLDALTPALLAIFLGSYLMSRHLVPLLREDEEGRAPPGAASAGKRLHDLASLAVPLAIAGGGLVVLFWLDLVAIVPFTACSGGSGCGEPEPVYAVLHGVFTAGLALLVLGLALLVAEAYRRYRRGGSRAGRLAESD